MLGSPISHSLSPILHGAAYRELGLDWDYRAIQVGTGELDGFLSTLGDEWRGLSLTMPLKREVLPLLDRVDDTGALVGAANTVLLDDGRLLGFNTDVLGVTQALAEFGITSLAKVMILGAGATAASVLAAVAGLGATEVSVLTRSPHTAAPLERLASALQCPLSVRGFDATPFAGDAATTVVISTLPGDTGLVQTFATGFRAHTPLVDIAYDPWPTAIASHWVEAGGTAFSGLAMLIHQAVAQVRIFTSGDVEKSLDGEAAVLAAMRSAVGATTPTL